MALFEKRVRSAEKKPLIKPPRLKSGDIIGIISPAGPVLESDLVHGLSVLETSGFRVRLGHHVFDTEGYLAGTDENRLSDFHLMHEDPDVKAVFCGRGGYGSLRLLERINYSLINANPKILVGYSDLSALLLAVYRHTGIVTFHGPMVRGLSRSDSANWENLLRCICSDGGFEIPLDNCSVLRPGNAYGPLIGGNLSLICHLAGTQFMPSFDRAILFLEEIGEKPYRIDRMLTHLKLTGILDGLAAIILGEFEDCGDPVEIRCILSNMAGTLEIPVISGFPVGHGRRNLTLPIGIKAYLETERQILGIEESSVQ